jgi:hypothetical protein
MSGGELRPFPGIKNFERGMVILNGHKPWQNSATDFHGWPVLPCGMAGRVMPTSPLPQGTFFTRSSTCWA